MMDLKKLSELKVFIDQCKSDPSLLSTPSFSFFREHLERLKALVAISKVQPRYAVAIGKKYTSMKSLLKVYMDHNMSEHEKELLVEDLNIEGLTAIRDANAALKINHDSGKGYKSWDQEIMIPIFFIY